MYKIIGISIIIILFIAGCNCNKGTDSNINVRATPATTDADDPIAMEYPNFDTNISIINLLANGERYHNNRVRVCGWIRGEFEHYALYLSREAAEFGDTGQSLWLEPEDRNNLDAYSVFVCYDKKYVRIEGIFQHKVVGSWRGVIMNVLIEETLQTSREP
jgi:hypothetical protein